MRSCERNRANQNGSILIFALFIVAVVSAIIAANLERSGVDTRVAGTHNRRARAVGDTGTNLGHGLQVVREHFGNFEEVPYGALEFNEDGVQDALVLECAPADAPGDPVDPDDRVTLPCSDPEPHEKFVILAANDGIFALGGTSRGVSQTLEAHYRVEKGTYPPDLTSPIGLCSNNVDISGADHISGSDFDPPAYPCSGDNCNGTDTGAADVPVIAYNPGTIVDTDPAIDDANIDDDAGLDCEGWKTFVDAAAGLAQTKLSASDGPFTGPSMDTAFGTPADPRIIVVDGPGEAHFPGNIYGNGILIIRNADAIFNGTFTFAGLIIIEGESASIDFRGTTNIFGEMMVLGSTVADAPAEIDASGDVQYYYSATGDGRANAAFNGVDGPAKSARFIRYAWRVRPNKLHVEP